MNKIIKNISQKIMYIFHLCTNYKSSSIDVEACLRQLQELLLDKFIKNPVSVGSGIWPGSRYVVQKDENKLTIDNSIASIIIDNEHIFFGKYRKQSKKRFYIWIWLDRAKENIHIEKASNEKVIHQAIELLKDYIALSEKMVPLIDISTIMTTTWSATV